MKLLWIAAIALGACGSHDEPAPAPQRDPARQKRVIEPPTGKVRPLPPHAIRGDGVGPYKLGTSLADVLDQLPSGPRIATLDIPGVVHASILRAEDDAILIGGEPLGKASFVAVVGGEVARTESGLHVGSTRDEVVRSLGAPVDEPDRARDPRVIEPNQLRDARVILDGDRVISIVLVAQDHVASTATSTCTRPTADDHRIGTCMTPTGELVTADSDEIVVRPVETDKPIVRPIKNLVFAAPVRASDSRDDLVAIARSDDGQQRVWTLYAMRLEGARLVPVADPTPVYQLSAANARWIGAELRDLDLYLEVTSHADTFEVGGLLTTRIGDRLRDVVVISPVSVPRHRVRPPVPEASDAGVADGAR